MLQLNRNTEYGLMALQYLVQHAPGAVISARQISDQLHIPFDNVAKALQRFAKIKLVTSVQGVAGGYHLAGDLRSFSIMDVMVALDGPLNVVRCGAENESCEHEPHCNVMNPLMRLNEELLTLLKNKTLIEFFTPVATALPESAARLVADPLHS